MNKTAEQRKELKFYTPQLYGLDPAVLTQLRTLKPYKPALAALHAWFWLFVLVKTYLYFPSIAYLYPVVIFFIAGRAGVFLQLAHEAAHGLISKGWFNNWFGNWVACYPIGLDLKGYAEPHVRHHACTNKICDPLSDSEKYKICDIRNPKLWFLFLKDILGITAVTIRFLYDQPVANKYKKDIEDYLETNEEIYAAYRAPAGSPFQKLKKYFSIGLVQVAIMGLLFSFNLVHYFFLWIIPLVTAHMFLMRVRGIAEHGLGIQLGVLELGEKNRGTFYTRSFGTSQSRYSWAFFNFMERLLIGSLNVFYHHEHHLFPKVPYYNLEKLHQIIREQEKENNPYIFAKGYFDCLFFNLKEMPSFV